jgi:Putative metallopeptidase
MTSRRKFQIPIAFQNAGRGGLWLIALCLSTGLAFAQTSTPAATEQSRQSIEAGLEANLDAAARELAKDHRFKEHTEQQRRDIIEFVVGNVIYAVVHEVGHMLVSELTLPVLGHEEDAADAFAILTALQLDNAFSDRVLNEAARGWFLSEHRDKKEKIPTVYYDEHGLDEQRAYNIVCLMVGSHPQKFSALANKTKLPEERQKTCHIDYGHASRSWEDVLTPHIRKPDHPKSQIIVAYADIPQYESVKRSLSHMRLLETLAEHLSDRYVWRGEPPVAFVMMTCGEPGAFWHLPTRRIIVCYELAIDYADLYHGYAEHEIALPSRKIAKHALHQHPRHRSAK